MSRSFRVLRALAAALILSPMAHAQSGERPQVMVVGLAHLVAKADLHNSTWGSSVFSPGMQKQIARITQALARFKPTKVMIEARADKPEYVQRYEAYRHGRYRLGPNEDDQLGYRLAGLLQLPTIYPIDNTGNFPFDYDAVKASAARNGQTSILALANAGFEEVVGRENGFERANDITGALRYLNAKVFVKANDAWYLYMDLIGNGSGDDSGHSLTSYWYARNLQIFANIARNLRPGDRAVVFIGAGHAAMLRPMIDHAPFLSNVDPERYLP
ncbi:MAG: DUF5694 domain-containing protein [Steroidobacteraceae bacterium]